MLLFLSLISCSSKAQLQRTVHQAPDLLILLDKGGEKLSSFSSPYDHPATISAERLQLLLTSVEVQPRTGLLNSMISGKKKRKPLFDSETARDVAIRISQALSEADPSERINFYRSTPRNALTVSVTSGFLFVKGEKLHLRANHYLSPLRKGFPPTSVGKDIPPSEKGKYAFALYETEHMTHRRFKNVLGLSGSDPHWLVIDHAALTSPSPDRIPPSTASQTPLSTDVLAEKLRALKGLREENLITEEEYQDKKKSILEEF